MSDVNDEILAELRKLTKLVTISNGKSIESELQQYATNDGRRKIWVLVDGKNQVDDIVKLSGLKQRTVYEFLKILEDAKLVEKSFGKPPIRLLDYVPPKWVELLQITASPVQNESQQEVVKENISKVEADPNG